MLDECKTKCPNMFLVGAARCGTTSLANYLGQHPEIYMSPVKEPFYFVSDFGLRSYDEYISLFRKAGNAKVIGEASTGYLYDRHAAKEIYDRFPNVKILIILRNPADMAFSLWNNMRIHGTENQPFEMAIKQEDIRRSDGFKNKCANWSSNYYYLDRAKYYQQVKRYIDVFGADRVSVYIFEEFVQDPLSICQDIFKFLGVDHSYVPDLRIYNAGGEIRFKILRKIRNLGYPFLKAILPLSITEKGRLIFRAINVKSKNNVEITPETRKELSVYYVYDILKLEQLLGRNLVVWKTI